MDIGGRIRSARKRAGLSQEEVARRAGMSLKGMSYIEVGRVADPHISSLRSIAEALGVPVGELLGETAAPGKAQAPSPPEGGAETGQPEDAALAVLFRGLAQRGREIFEQSREEGPSEPLGRKLKAYERENVALLRLAGGRDILGKRSEEFHEAQDAYEEVDRKIRELLEQDVAGVGQELRARRLRSGQDAGDARTEAG